MEYLAEAVDEVSHAEYARKRKVLWVQIKSQGRVDAIHESLKKAGDYVCGCCGIILRRNIED